MSVIERVKNAYEAFAKPTVNLNDEEFSQWLGITPKNRKKISEITYFTCMKMLSETMGKLPLKYYQETERGKIRADPTSMTHVLRVRPNPIMTPTTFWCSVELNCQHWGNSYVWIRREFVRKKVGGEVNTHDIWILPTKDVTVIMDDSGVFGAKGNLYYRYVDAKTGEMYVFPQRDIMHFKTWYTFDGIMGEPVRNIIGGTVDGAHASQEFMNKLYEQGLTASMAMQYAGDLNETLIKQLQKKFEKYMTGTKNAGKIVPVPIGMQLTPLKMTLTDAQFFELRKYSALQIAGAFGIKPNQINNYEKSSYANSETQQIAFLVDTMLFRMKMYEEEINEKCLTPQEMKQGYRYKFNEKVILRTDSKTQMENLTKGVNNGIYKPDEAREYLDLPSEEGGDRLYMNGNYIPITDVGKQYSEGGEE